MSARRSVVVALVAAVLAVALWWLSRGAVEVPAPEVDPPVEGSVSRTVTTTWLLMAATVAAGISMVFATLASIRTVPARRG